jgi:hypothetical protein
MARQAHAVGDTLVALTTPETQGQGAVPAPTP